MTKKTLFHLMLIAIVGLAAYSNTFGVPFHFDDPVQIADNPVIRDLGNFISSLKGYLFNPRRYVGYLTFALNYYFGGLDVTGYHVVNLAIHVLNAVLVYFFVVLTLRTPYFSSQRSALSDQLSGDPPFTIHDSPALDSSLFTFHVSRFTALFAALLFVSHPVQTQAVTYIVQRLTSLATMFYLLSMVMYIKARQSAQSKEQSVEKSLPYAPSVLLYALCSLLCAVCAMKTKEIAFTLPVMILLYEFTFFRSSLKKKLLFLIPVLLTLVIIPASMMHTDKPLGEMLSDLSEKTRVQTEISRGDYLMTEMRVIVTYIRLLFLPVNQNLDYDYPVYRSFFTPPVFMSFLFLSALLAMAIYLLYKSQSEKLKVKSEKSEQTAENLLPFTFHLSRLIAFGILWFFIGLSVESSVIPIVDVIFEHRLYLPSVGAFVALAAGLSEAIRKAGTTMPKAGKTAIPLALIVVILLSCVTYRRNMIWQDGVTLWEDVARKAPANARAQNNLGYLYLTRGMPDKAAGHFIAAVRLIPNYLDARINLGIAYNAEGMTDAAIEQLTIALGINPDDADAHNNIGVAYVAKGMLEEGITHYQTALRINPDYPEAYNNLGSAYGTKGLLDQAIPYFRYATKLRPDYFEAHYNLARAFLKKNDPKNAEEVYLHLAGTNPGAAKKLLEMLKDGAL